MGRSLGYAAGCQWLGMILVAAAVALSACSSPAQPDPAVTKDQFLAAGKVWPLTVDHGDVGCTPNPRDRRGDAFWFRAPNGTRFGLNSYASEEQGFADLTPIWAEDAKMNAEVEAAFPGQKLPVPNRLSIGDLADAAQLICYAAKLN